jgi:type II secretory pathway predicted ATPase ExeA
MFLDFYKMNAQPFGVTPDPRFLYLGKSHREALASLYYAVESDRGFVALIAQPGLGKTTLTFKLLEKLQAASRTVFLFQTQCNSKELFHYLLNGLGVDAQGMDLVSMHNKLNEILCRELLAGRRFVLAIDEAQNLGLDVLETVRLLSNFETSQTKLLQILLIGQPQLARKLASPELEQLQQRIGVFASLEPFSSDDTARYIAHRLQVAGYEGSPLLTPGALRIVAEKSQGIPRKINSLCFSALSLACAMGRERVDVGIMEEVLADQDVECLQRPSVARPVAATPMTSRPILSGGYPTVPKGSFGRWALAAASVAVFVAMGIGIFSVSPSRFDPSIQMPSEAWASIRNSAASIRRLFRVKSGWVPHSSTPNIQAAELPNSEVGQFSASKDYAVINTVIVQPGETLRQIILRSMGEYNDDTIEQIRKLNPAIGDFNHIEPGQAIRLPRIILPVHSTAPSEVAGIDGKNLETSHHE